MVKDVMYGKTPRKSFARYQEILEMPNLLEVQKTSYQWFLDTGLREVFKDVGPITDYAMVIQCGGCMITGKQLKNRLQPAIDAGIPVSNYGMTIAYLHGIFGRAMKVFQD